MGLLQIDPEDWFKWSPVSLGEGISDSDIGILIERRQIARANKDFALSDKIRDDLFDQGIVLEDSGNGTTWKRA
jgi:cysteinyl-tRNA synthetase